LGFDETVFIFLSAPASSGFWRSIAFVEMLVKNRRMKPIRDRRAISGRRSAPFRNRPRRDEQPEEEEDGADRDERNEEPPHAADGNGYGRRISGGM